MWQAVALGAAVQAGVLEGSVKDVMIMDVWKASLMRAFAKKRIEDDPSLAAQQGLMEASSENLGSNSAEESEDEAADWTKLDLDELAKQAASAEES